MQRPKTAAVLAPRWPNGKKMKKFLAVFYAFIFFTSATFYALSYLGYRPDLSLQLFIPILIILSFNYVWLKWTAEMKGVITEKEKFKVPARSLFDLIALVTALQVGADIFLERKNDRIILSLNLFFSLLMSYSYLFGKKYGRIVLFKFIDSK